MQTTREVFLAMVAVGPGHGAMIKPMAPSPYWGEEKIWDSKANNLGFYAKGFDGRIDAPNAGWKGRGLWTTSDDRAPWLMEGGKGKKPIVVHFQLRPEPLAR